MNTSNVLIVVFGAALCFTAICEAAGMKKCSLSKSPGPAGDSCEANQLCRRLKKREKLDNDKSKSKKLGYFCVHYFEQQYSIEIDECVTSPDQDSCSKCCSHYFMPMELQDKAPQFGGDLDSTGCLCMLKKSAINDETDAN